MKVFKLIFLAFMMPLGAFAQNFSISLQPKQINNMPGIQAFAFGQVSGQWLLIGGRTDGLHRRQPFASFDAAGNNTTIYLVNPTTNSVKSASISSLPASLLEQLQSTNMNFKQVGNQLYIVGGYGYSATAANHITYPYLTVVDLQGLATSITNAQPIAPFFSQINDARFAVTGGHLEELDGVFYLVCGNKFDGRYNPMGNNTYTQKYTEQIKRFTINSTPSLSAIWLDSITDAANLHRRDYNLTPQIFPSGKKGFTIWSGVFQPNVDLPFLNSVDIVDNSHTVNNTFNQYLSQYHSAQLPVYSAKTKQMSTVFFGGIAQYYYDANNQMLKDDNVPFVNTISVVTRMQDGTMVEKKIGEMAGYLGASSEFIANTTSPFNTEGILNLDSITADSVLVGYIVGGINSTAGNIFTVNDGTQSTASTAIYSVYLKPQTTSTGVQVKLPQLFSAKVYSSQEQQILIELNNAKPQEYSIWLTDITGRQLQGHTYTYITIEGSNLIKLETDTLSAGIYMVNIRCGQVYQSHKVLIK